MSELTDRLRTAYEGFGQRDIDAILAVMQPDIEWDATDALAHTGLYHGHDGVREYITTLSSAWDEFHLVPELFTESASADSVMVLGAVRGRLAANHQEVEARFAHVLQIEDGRVSRLKVCLDRDAALRELDES